MAFRLNDAPTLERPRRLVEAAVSNRQWRAPDITSVGRVRLGKYGVGTNSVGRNGIGQAPIGQADIQVLKKAVGEGFHAEWRARNDGEQPGTARLVLLDESNRALKAGPDKILEPGEEVTLSLDYTPQPSELQKNPDELIYQLEFVPNVDEPTFASSWHLFVVSYTAGKKKPTGKEDVQMWKGDPPVSIMVKADMVPSHLADGWTYEKPTAKAGEKKRDADFAEYLKVLDKYGVTAAQVPYNQGDWVDAMTEFLETRDTRQGLERNWLDDLATNGLSKDELSFADWQAGKMQDVVNARGQKKADKEEHDKYLNDWSNFQMEMLNAGISFSIPAFTSDWRSTLESTRTEYEDRRAYKTERVEILKDNPALASRSDIPEYSAGWRNRLSSWTDTKLTQIEAAKTFADKTEYMKARNKAGFSSREVSYSANWRSTLSTAKSKRISDNLRAETKKRQDKIAADAKVAREAIEEERRAKARLATELQKQRDKDKNVLRRALLALRQQQTDTSDVEWTPTPSFATPRAGDVPGLTTPAFAYTGKQETARENNRLSPVFVSPFVVHERVAEGTARVVESSSGNFLTVFDHQATGEGGDLDDWI